MRKLEQYKGPLSASQIADGMNGAIANARRLADAASLLLDNGHYPLAASTAVLSIEESGKLSILRSLAVARSKEDLTQYWRQYRSHTKKNVMWILPQIFIQGASRLDDFKPLFEEDAQHPFLLDQIKQLGFYTDCLGKSHWSLPTEVIDEQLATSIIKIAQILSQEKQITEIEIELWVKHIGPVWKGPKKLMEMALVQ